jgi:exosome complex RNA-binding protein Rrp4
MSKKALLLLTDIEKDTVDFRPNYENTLQEPSVLPAAVPGILLNGTLGIAVGMASNIPPHNLGEIMEATEHLLKNPTATTEDLLKFVKGPDFPVGGIIFNKKDIQHAYSTGRGGVITRGEAEIIEQKNGSFHIIISSVPFRVNKADLIQKIAEIHRDKRVDGIKALRDESTDDIRVVIGKGGETIQGLTADHDVKISIEDDGTVVITGLRENIKAARAAVEKLVYKPSVGDVFTDCMVKTIMDFGAFVEYVPGKDGLVHVSEIAQERVEHVTDYLKEGQKVNVLIKEIDRQGRVKLSMKDTEQA